MSGAGYAWDPSDYAAHSRPQFNWARELLDKLVLRGDEAVLDLGSGDGKVTAQIAARLPQGRAVGVDLSAQMVEHARRHFPAEDYPNLAFQSMDITELDFQESFDVVFSNAALHWVADHDAVLGGVRRALKKGGRLLFQMGGRGNASGMLESLEAVLKRPRWAARFKGFRMPYTFPDPEEYRTHLEAHRLEPVRVQLITKRMEHPGRAGLAGWLRTAWMPYVHRVRPSERADFIRESVEAYVSRFGLDAEGVIHVEMVRLEVEAAREG